MQEWHYMIVWEWLAPLQRWGVRLAHMMQRYSSQRCSSTVPDPTHLDPEFWTVPTYKIYEEYWHDGKKWNQCDPVDDFIIPTRNWK